MYKSQGFTLIELLTVIAIIGLLSAILFPVIHSAQEHGQKQVGMHNSREIALAYINYNTHERRILNVNKAKDLPSLALELTKTGYLEKADAFFAPGDFYAPNPTPITVATRQGNAWSLTNTFQGADAYSYDIAVGSGMTSPGSTTALVWTRGLKTDGSWSEEKGVYGSKGGHIVFLDSHVEWFDSLKGEEGGEARLVAYNSRAATSNILKAFSSRVKVVGKGPGSLNGKSGL